jgi:hypothetical protein
MSTASTVLAKWKLKYVTPKGIWLPLKGRPDIIVFGKTSSQRLASARKLVSGFKDEFDNAYIYEADYNGKMIAAWDKDLQRFITQ